MDEIERGSVRKTELSEWAAGAGPARRRSHPRGRGGTKVLSVYLPAELHDLVRRVAVSRQSSKPGHISASAVILDLILEHRAELEREAR